MARLALSDDRFAQVQDLGPLIQAHRQESDRLGYIAAPIIDAFFERDLFRILLPAELGGAGVDLLTSMRLVEQVAAFDGSTGWIFEIGLGGLIRLGFLPAE